MAWLELRLDTNSTDAEALEDSLLACGAQAITYTDAGDQPILEPGVGEMPLWPEIVLVALFENSVNTTQTIQQLKASQDEPLPNFRWNILEDQIWEREWLKHHKPVKFGDGFWVFHEQVPDTDQPILLLDPGLAFGTGSHPTTALCLDWIARQDWQTKPLIDYGCGSGILAIAAAMLGCPEVQCTDIDPQALLATRDNANRNQITETGIKLYLAGQEPDIQTPTLVANILSGPLVELAPTFAKKLLSGGQICLSGILDSQKDQILKQYQHWFEQLECTEKDGWLRVTGLRKSH